MGKTKTAFIVESAGENVSGKEKYEERKKLREEREKSNQEKEKVRVPGLGGGQRVVAISAEPVEEQETTEGSKQIYKKGPKVRGKQYREAKSKIDRNKNYKIDDAIGLVKSTSYSKFDGTVELHMLVKKASVSVNVTLPHSGGKAKRIEVADDKTIEKLKSSKIDFDILLATPDMMPKLVQFAKVLGPKGLMPNPKNGTIIKDRKDAVKFSGNTLSIRTEKKQPVIHTSVGKVSQDSIELTENINTVIDAVGRKVIDRAYVKPTMGPSVKLAI